MQTQCLLKNAPEDILPFFVYQKNNGKEGFIPKVPEKGGKISGKYDKQIYMRDTQTT